MFGRSKSDVELLRASLDGNTQAFGVVVGRYQSLVCAITYSATGDVGRSEELAQEAFLRAWKSLGQLQDLGKFRAWLCSIARSTVLNWFRSEKRDVVGRAAPLDVAAEKASYESGPEEAVMIQEQQAVVRQSLAQMPEKFREPLILFYREGRSTREVAELLGLSENAARQRIFRGRSMLREQMAEMVETAIARTKPGKAFTAAVIASVAGLSIEGFTTVATAGGAAAVTSLMSGLTAKVAAVALGAAILAGGIVGYRQLSKPREPAGRTVATRPAGGKQQAQSSPVLEVVQAGTAVGPVETLVAPAPVSTATAPGAQAGDAPSFSARDRRVALAQGAERFEFKARGVLSGLITDIGTGEPVRDAGVCISMGRAYTTRTDANGFYCFEKIEEAGNYGISVASEEYLGTAHVKSDSMAHLSPDQQIVKHYQFARACMVDVWVVDVNGVAIGDARVIGTSLADVLGMEVNRSIHDRRTDPNGYILLGGFPPAQTDYLITAWRSEGTDSRAPGQRGYAPAKAVVRLTDPNVVRQVQIVLEPGQDVTGCAVYEDGFPAVDVGIVAAPVWWHCRYGLNMSKVRSDGTFTVTHIVPGVYDLSSYIPSSGSGYTSRKVMQAQLPPADGTPLVVCIAGASPQSQVAIDGSLVFRGEKRPSNVQIRATSADGRVTNAMVKQKLNGDVEDTFVVDRLTPGTYSLRFSGRDMEDTTVNDVVAPSSGLRVELVYAGAPKLSGCIVNAQTGEPIRDFRVRVKKLRSLRGPGYLPSNYWTHCENEQGHFAADSVGPGIYQVQAVAEGYAPAWSGQINTDEPASVVVALSPGGAICGWVVNGEGEPVDGARIIPLSLAGGTTAATEGAFTSEHGAVETSDGAFTLSHLPPGIETLKVVHPDYAPQVVESIPVAADQTTKGVQIVLAAGGTVEGYVYDLQGKPQPGHGLYLQSAVGSIGSDDEPPVRLGEALTDANGYYRIDHVVQQLCHVRRKDEGESLGVVRRAVLPRDGRIVRVDLGGVPVIRGRVVVDGFPVAGARLLIEPARSQHTGAFRGYAVTDEQGNFTFGGAPPGTYSIHSQRPNEQPRWLPLGTITAGNADVDAGTLSARATSLLLKLNDTGSAGEWPIDSVSLSTGQRLWSASAGIASPPSKAGDPYLIKSIAPGRYTLSVRRRDQVFWQQSAELDPAKNRWELSLDLPASKANVSGRIRGVGARTLVLCREQKDVIAVVQLGSGGAFRVEHLPAGRYWIGDLSSALYDLPPLAEFSLRDDEEKILDLDLSEVQDAHKGFVLVQVVDEAGLPCDNAQIRLDGPHGPVGLVYSEEAGQGFLTMPGPHTLYVQAAGCRPVVRRLNVRLFDPNLARPQTVLVCLERL